MRHIKRKKETQIQSDHLDKCLNSVGQYRDERCFIEVYDHYAGRIKSYLLCMDIEEKASEDLTQQIMLTVWRTSKKFDPTKVNSCTWIFAILRNHWLEYSRGQSRVEIDADDVMLQAHSHHSQKPAVASPKSQIDDKEGLRSALPLY